METILCVDDDLNLLRLYQDELSEEGYCVIPARREGGLTEFESEDFEVVLMDIRMPQMNGIETLTAILGKVNDSM